MDLDKKRLYDEVSELYRFHLIWRQRLFAGYLICLASLSAAAGWLHESAQRREQAVSLQGKGVTSNNADAIVLSDAAGDQVKLKWAVLFLSAATLLTVVFFGLDFRNRSLFEECAKCGQALEDEMLKTSAMGPYGRLNWLQLTALSHSTVIDFLFVMVLAGVFAIARRLDHWAWGMCSRIISGILLLFLLLFIAGWIVSYLQHKCIEPSPLGTKARWRWLVLSWTLRIVIFFAVIISIQLFARYVTDLPA